MTLPSLDIKTLFEDHALLVIHKPPGIVVNRAASVKEETVEDWVEKKLSAVSCQLSAQNSDFCSRAGIVHRIDKETSGILIIAKTPEAFVELQRQFKERAVKKTYLAIVHGKLVPEEGEIRVPVGRLPWNPERFGVVPGGKEAVTRYKVVKSQKSKVKSEDISLVELYPETGRTHQIRVHMKYINHPIVGDYLYAGRKVSRRDRAGDAPRVMLHAWKVEFEHPASGKHLAIESPIPDDMNRIIQN
ncbi:hypothetical protein A2973_05475 [Candidatus Gottesmanbacteria bacterium RIFCSPLOWO2_01_FULL_49_10]|uniref:Pseudouridine synthase n=1 Tax=Candidatus Gottesmanbacteria bacterium RIFCSPLOWO2_01_FULL_49_10 TaxID=1798396 RepID=A0A1F6B136_9BACT|nr:MAG: Pseudouridine synthase [Microgenomates group bacterium GW2011_GWA2_47_8]OGG30626.1 MAG: hypothetical protein A2973_05475 [Candidatus Gottesmanbacteria bacterium RIFCSPLOWO2_01_FULL_49_10]